MLECKGIDVSFGGNHLLKDFNHLFEPGITALVGNNGTGKSTLINIMSGFLAPDNGQVIWQGKDLVNLDPVDIVKLGVVRSFQDSRMVTSLLGWQHVALGLPRHGKDLIGNYLLEMFRSSPIAKRKKEVMALMDRLQIQHLAEKPVSTLSIGQRRLVGLATCFASESDCYLLDEPTAGLDSNYIGLAEAYLKGLATKDKVVVLVEHNMKFVESINAHKVTFGEGYTF